MELCQEWKSFFPVGVAGSTVSPLLVSHSDSLPLGPLLFNPNNPNPNPNPNPNNPNPNSFILLFSSPSLLPALDLPSHLLPTRFLHCSSVLPSTASSLSSLVTPVQNDCVPPFPHNRIHLLQCPTPPNVVVFFPTGANDHNIGFFMLSVRDGQLHTHLDANGHFFTASTGSAHRIFHISVNSAVGFGLGDDGDCHVIGYLLASTLYAVHWFAVKQKSSSDCPNVCYLGGKTFKTHPVVHACWSPHIFEECLVLLENGDLFLFDLESHDSGIGVKGNRLKVPWSGCDSEEKNKSWLSCEFSWHPRVFVVARSDAVFLVDLRKKECGVSCVMKIDALRMYGPAENEEFFSLSRAGPDDFHFVVASNTLLVLCDVRKPLLPVLQWMHTVERPCFLNVLRLSMLRSHSREAAFNLASESGFCVVLGSFWNCEFSTFCYGSILPFGKVSVNSKINPGICAWELPSQINLSGHRECHCGTCLLRKELSKDALPEWIDWQLKKEIVLGFGVLNNDLAALLCEPDEHGGFTLIRLMSSGRFELQRYHASWMPARNLEDCHDQVFCLDRHLLYPTTDEEYKFPKIFHYLKLNHFDAYASGNLTRFLVRKLRRFRVPVDAEDKEPLCAQVHELLCEKLNACGLGRSRSCPEVTCVFNDVKVPSSLHEVALRRLWAELPVEILQLAYLSYGECHEVVGDLDQNRVALQFSAVPNLPQLPPFFLRKSSPLRNDDIVGPVIPFPVLLVLDAFFNRYPNLKGEFSVETELGLKYKEVMQVAREIAVSAYETTDLDIDDGAVSLAEDGQEARVGSPKPKSFVLYHPDALNSSAADLVQGKSVYSDFIFHVPVKKSNEETESVGLEIFDDLSPVELRFDAPVKNLEPQCLKSCNLLKRQMSKWQENFDPYKEFCVQSGFEKSS